MDSKPQELKARYIEAKTIVARHEVESVLHTGNIDQVEFMVMIAESDAENVFIEEEMYSDRAREVLSLEDELIISGVPPSDIWQLDPMEFANKWMGNFIVKKRLRATTSLPIEQDIASSLVFFRSIAPASCIK